MNKLFLPSGFRLLIFMLVIAAISFRLIFFLFGLRQMPISSDEAWPALMGLHVLKGEFPVFYWGQNYMGSQQAFFDALVFGLFGLSTFAARIYPLFFSFLYVAACLLLARRLSGRETALTTFVLLAVPAPYLTMAGTLSVPPEYLPLSALGSCALILLAGMVLKSDGSASAVATRRCEALWRSGERYGGARQAGGKIFCADNNAKTCLRTMLSFFLLGLLLGFIFWLHLVAISFIVVALLFLFLRDKRLFFRPAFLIFIVAFFIGSFPFWWFNFTRDFITFADVGGTCGWQRSLQLLKALFGITLPFMTGMKVMLYGDSRHFVGLPFLLASALGLIWCALVALVILKRFRGMLRWLRWKPEGADGTAILIALVVVILYFFCRSERSGWHNARFILPVMSALPILLACGLEEVRQWSRYAFAFLLFVVIGAQAWGNVLLYREWSNPEVVGRKLELPDTAPLHRFLNEHGITHAYAHYWISYRITFESREQIICAEPFNERFPGRRAQYLDEVHEAANAAFITHPTLQFVPNFEDHLRALGGTYRKSQAGDFTVYYDFRPPYGKINHTSAVIKLREIERTLWRLLSDNHPEILKRMLDGDPNTSWTTGEAQKPGHYLLIDLGGVERVCKVMFDMSAVEHDAPHGYRLEISTDGEQWRTVYKSGAVAAGFFWENDHPWMFVGNNFYNAAFAPVEARYIRVLLTALHHRYWWSIAELRVFGLKEM